MTLRHLSGAVRRRAVSAEELVRESLGRIERLDPRLNAVVLTCPDEALAEARSLDARVVAGDDPGPLAGLPLLVKDNEDRAGLPTTFGSLLRAGAPPATEDCEAVARLRGAVAVVVGKTNLPEFAFEGFTSNRLFGDTRNPWAPEWSPGGSSGGSAAALVAGFVPLATGTDGGGSIRIPAAFSGLAGLKPTNGIVGRRPIPSWIDLSTKGPMGTTIEDLRLLLDVLGGPVAGDPTALPAWSPRQGVRPDRLIAADRFSDWGPLPDGIATLFSAALQTLEGATGLPVERIDPPFPTQVDDDWFLMVAVEERSWLGGDLVDTRAHELTSYIRHALEHVAHVSIEGYMAARRRRFAFVRSMDELLGSGAVLVTPTMCVEGFLADGRMPGADRPGTDSAVYNTQIQNSTGHPALSVPAGLSANGVPFGLQITGPRFADDLVLAVGEAWETASPWPATAPGYEPFRI